jgi:hypothetical protein
MAMVIIRATQIDDVARWRAGFAENAPKRQAHGFGAATILVDANDPRTIMVVTQVESIERARGILGDASIKETMIRHGVTVKPEMWFLQDAPDP